MELYIIIIIIIIDFKTYNKKLPKKGIFCKNSINWSKKYLTNFEILSTVSQVCDISQVTDISHSLYQFHNWRYCTITLLKRIRGNIQYFKRINYYIMTVTIENPIYNEIDVAFKNLVK